MGERQRIIILGTSLGAEHLADLIDECPEFELTAFAENWDRERCARPLLGRPVLWIDDLPPLAATHRAVCAIASNQRWRFVEPVEAMGFRFAVVRHPTAHVSATAVIEAGTTISVGAIIGAHTRLGRHVIVHRGTLIAHHTTIGDYVTFGPGANVAGAVTIGPRTWVGMGAIVVDYRTVGTGCVVGAGAVVTADVPDHVQVVGVPARISKEHVDGR
ncbi:MAG TPA: acetyltransferase [Pseudonocardiaceae bacterium]